jgi:hypothetical protein
MDKESFTQWMEHPVTKEVMKIINDTRLEFSHSLMAHASSGETVSAARAAGNMEGLDYLLNIQYEDTQ